MNIHTFYGFYCALAKIQVNLEFWKRKNFQGISTAKWVSKNIKYQPKNTTFGNTLTFALIMLEFQTTIS